MIAEPPISYNVGEKVYLSRRWLGKELPTDPFVEVAERTLSDDKRAWLYRVQENGQIVKNAQGESWVPESKLVQ